MMYCKLWTLLIDQDKSGNTLDHCFRVSSTSSYNSSSSSESRGIHLFVMCRSVCDQDQNNWIKQSKPFLSANQVIKVTSEPQKSKDQEHTAAI